MNTLYLVLILLALFFVFKPSGYVAASADTILSTAQIQNLINLPGSDIRHRCAAQYYSSLNIKSKAIHRMGHAQFLNTYVKPIQSKGLSFDQGFLKCLVSNNAKLT